MATEINPFEGKTVVLTGTLLTMKRADAQDLLARSGANISGSVSKNTDLLIYGDKAGSKLSKAKSLGIAMMTEAEFVSALSQTSPAPAPAKAEAPQEEVETVESEFTGKKIVLTGTFVTMKRSEAQDVLKKAGASVSGSVSKNTDLLIYGDKAGSKLSKAQSLGIALMTEEELVAKLNAASVGSSALDGAAEKLAQAQAAEDEKMKGVRELIEKTNKPYLDLYGMTPGQLLLAYLKVLAARPDVHVYTNDLGRPTSNKQLLDWHRKAPPELIALAADIPPLVFNWVLDEYKGERNQYSEGYRGGRLSLPVLDSYRWWPIADWQKEYEDFEAEAIFDNFVAEGVTRLSYNPGEDPTKATLIFDDANDCARHPLGGIYDYLQRGARCGFTWYWQNGESEFTAELLSASIPENTSDDDIQSYLQAKGLTAEEATGLRKWLGDRVNILLHISELPGGEEIAKKRKHFPLSTQASDRDMDISMVRQLASSQAEISKDELAQLLDDHGLFLDAGGAGGAWQTLSVSGLPLCIYTKAEQPKGAQAVFRLKNIARADLQSARLDYADLSGTYAEGANFSKASIKGGMMIDSVFEGADFSGANLTGADLSGCQLAGANFSGADLTNADFECADCTGANFEGATTEGARFPGAMLADVQY